VSGEEGEPSSDLNTDKHGPLAVGWLSEKFCHYPIDMIIQFDKKIVLKKVQILSHQYLIASKIEFYIGDCPEKENINYDTAKYTRLGYYK
jgi:centrosomal protein CEP104